MKYFICIIDWKNFNSLDNRRDLVVYIEYWNVRLLVKCIGYDVVKYDSVGYLGINF